MKKIERIVIYNNEVSSERPERHYGKYLITFRSENRSVKYEDLLRDKPIRTLVNYSKFDELFSFVCSLLLDTPKPRCGYHRIFRNVNEYHKWRNNLNLVEEEILWRMNVHYLDGSFETSIFKDCEKVPSYISRLENQVKRILGLKHDQSRH